RAESVRIGEGRPVSCATRRVSCSHRNVRPLLYLPFSRVIALSLRPSAARSSFSCKVKVTSDVLCYNRWGALRQVQCLVESGRGTTELATTPRTVQPVIANSEVHQLGVNCLNFNVKLHTLSSFCKSLFIKIT
ncbi:unnamed protein product, partial [Leptidea sinapis]